MAALGYGGGAGRGGDNRSQTSFADEHDYSRKRVLRVANPSEE